MRKYLFGTGMVGAILGGVTLLRGMRDTQFTWREGLAWLSWGISFALAVGAVIDVRRASRGHLVSAASPVYGKEQKLLKKNLRR